MSSTTLQLPAPRHVAPTKKKAPNKQQQQQGASNTTRAPSYEDRLRSAAQAVQLPKHQRPKLFVPRTLKDFDDGGAFPEIHVAQYPLHMGQAQLQANKQPSNALATIQVDQDGQVSYDAIVKGGTNSDKIVYSKLEHMKPSVAKPEDVALPTKEQEQAEANKTMEALNMLISKKTELDTPTGSAVANARTSTQSKTEFIKYTAHPDAPGYNPAAAHRVIQMVNAQVDPMEPPKHQHVKAPRGPAEDPVPILHAPPEKLTQAERNAWNIPACISNWKNTRGYTIPLDKRLAADGRNLLQPEINSDGFANLSESLYVAEQQARQEVKLRSFTQKQLLLDQKSKQEEELRALAQQARLERGGVPQQQQQQQQQDEIIDRPPPQSDDEDDISSIDQEDDNDDDEDQVAAQQREKLRLARKRERERELRLEQSLEAKRQKFEQERDVSEKIALGAVPTTGTGGEMDSRLYNTSEGMDSGFGREDEYNAYSKPLFDQSAAASIYRPTGGNELDADAQYESLKGGKSGHGTSKGPRTAPVQFEKETKKA